MAIRSFRHKGLRTFYETGSRKGIQAAQADRLRVLLGRLGVAREPRDMAAPGFGLHPLKGRAAGRWSVSVSGNWRVTFAFDGQDVTEVDYEDYH